MSSLTALPGRQQQSLTSLQHFHQGLHTTIHRPELPTAAGPERGRAAGPPSREQPGGFGAVSAAPAEPWKQNLGTCSGFGGCRCPLAGQHGSGLCPAAMPEAAELTGARPWRGTRAERLCGGLETALLCLKMSDCFVPGCLLRRFTGTSLKCNLNSSTLPLLKGCRNKSSRYPGIPPYRGREFTCDVSGERRKQTCKTGSDLHVPSGLVFPLTAARAPAGNGTEQITPR